MAFTLKSSAFAEGGSIPMKYTCDGQDLSPQLTWSDAPAGAKSFALIMDDPDAPSGTFTHWVLYGVPGNTNELPEGVKGSGIGQTIENDFGKPGYGGPCPPRGHGPHRYYFTVYALDVTKLEPSSANRGAVEKAMQGHTLGTARLMGAYERRARP